MIYMTSDDTCDMIFMTPDDIMTVDDIAYIILTSKLSDLLRAQQILVLFGECIASVRLAH